jgi:hypothetical protein
MISPCEAAPPLGRSASQLRVGLAPLLAPCAFLYLQAEQHLYQLERSQVWDVEARLVADAER